MQYLPKKILGFTVPELFTRLASPYDSLRHVLYRLHDNDETQNVRWPSQATLRVVTHLHHNRLLTHLKKGDELRNDGI